ncbi:MAG: hypothetical protein FWB91_06790 [Defluviitaleaceae bacterium]|nr:hypothetical protein [Defluviitaleaceae bacterium]
MSDVDTTYLNTPLKINTHEWIPQNTVINNVHTIAGKGVNESIRVTNKLTEMYGGVSDGWMKRVGKIVSGKYEFDIHWYEHVDIGCVDFKIKTYKERGWL